MALFQQITGVLIIGAEHTALHILVTQQRHQSLQVTGGSALADHNELAALQLGNRVVQIGALMVGIHAGGNIGIQVIAHQAGRVTVDLLMMRLRCHDLGHHLGIAVDDAVRVHHLSQALHTGMIVEAVDGTIVQIGAGLVQGRGRYAGGEHETHIYRQILGGLQHVLNAVRAHDIGDLVGVSDHGGGAVSQNSLGKLLGVDQGALQMNMGIQKAGQHDLAGYIHFLYAAVFAHTHDQTFGNSNVTMAQLVGKYIHIGGIFQHQIGFLAAGSNLNDVQLFIQLTVDFTGITLFHRHRQALLRYLLY